MNSELPLSLKTEKKILFFFLFVARIFITFFIIIWTILKIICIHWSHNIITFVLIIVIVVSVSLDGNTSERKCSSSSKIVSSITIFIINLITETKNINRGNSNNQFFLLLLFPSEFVAPCWHWHIFCFPTRKPTFWTRVRIISIVFDTFTFYMVIAKAQFTLKLLLRSKLFLQQFYIFLRRICLYL